MNFLKNKIDQNGFAPLLCMLLLSVVSFLPLGTFEVKIDFAKAVKNGVMTTTPGVQKAKNKTQKTAQEKAKENKRELQKLVSAMTSYAYSSDAEDRERLGEVVKTTEKILVEDGFTFGREGIKITTFYDDLIQPLSDNTQLMKEYFDAVNRGVQANIEVVTEKIANEENKQRAEVYKQAKKQAAAAGGTVTSIANLFHSFAMLEKAQPFRMLQSGLFGLALLTSVSFFAGRMAWNILKLLTMFAHSVAILFFAVLFNFNFIASMESVGQVFRQAEKIGDIESSMGGGFYVLLIVATANNFVRMKKTKPQEEA